MNDSKLPEYYAPIQNAHPRSTIQWIAFDIDVCEACGCTIMAPNSMHLSEPMARHPWPLGTPLPDDDGGYSDAHDGVTCSTCWTF